MRRAYGFLQALGARRQQRLRLGESPTLHERDAERSRCLGDMPTVGSENRAAYVERVPQSPFALGKDMGACARGSLSKGATRNTLVVRYKALSAGNYMLSGRISGARPDPNAANDVASVTFARP